MNRFRSRKKSEDGGDKKGRSRRGSLEDDVPSVPSFSTKAFRRNKKAQPEPKPEVDLTTALPATDHFRTSLLMPNLSARFSMLREQDDPTSKIGKANDDSVLVPKRASRLGLFNHGNLGEIAEVDSLRDSIRPPFASGRTESYSTDGYGTDEDASRNGGMMSRARPGEGNNLFGGRQKIYKIPMDGAGSVKSFGDKEEAESQPKTGMGGKAVYDDDVAMSAFQRLREQERRERQKREQFDLGTASTRSSKDDERSDSPPRGYNRNRETTSSTNSAASQPRTSTAATSVVSQRSMYAGPGGNGSNGALPSSAPGPLHSERQGSKGRRLYGNGLDQHMYEQQYSALHRLESVNRQRHLGGSAKALQGSRSATGLNDRFQRSGPSSVSAPCRPGSPPPTVSPLSPHEHQRSVSPDNGMVSPILDGGYGLARPMSPPLSPDQDPTLVASLEPNDLGKATASGVFNKPKKQYDEQQYLRRQLQLQQGRETPPPRPFSPVVGSIDQHTTRRTRENSNASSTRIQPESSGTEQHLNPVLENDHTRDEGSVKHPSMEVDGTFFSPPSASEASTPSVRSPSALSQNRDFIIEDTSRRGSARSSIPTVVHETPQDARTSQDRSDYMNQQNNQHLSSLSEEPAADSLSQRTITQSHNGSISGKSGSENIEIDGQSLGLPNGLSGLVKSHLRNASDQSSIYPEPSPGLFGKFPNEKSVENRASSVYQSGTFFDNDVEDAKSPEPRASQDSRYSETAVPPPLALNAQRILHQATAFKNEAPKAYEVLGNDKAQRILGKEAPRANHTRTESQELKQPSWEQQVKARHARGGSTETQKEREALANELASRSRKIQDNLKNIVEVDSRSGSPHPTNRNSPDDGSARTPAPFAILKSKGSKGSLGSDKAPKAMKMLGLGSSNSQSIPENAKSHQAIHPAHRQQGPPHALSGRRPSAEASGSRPSSRRANEAGSEVTSPRSHLDFASRLRNSPPNNRPVVPSYSDTHSVVSSASAQTPSLAAPSPSPRPSPVISTRSAPTAPYNQQQQLPPASEHDSSPPAPPHNQPIPLPYQHPTMINPPSQSHTHSRHHHQPAPLSYRKASINKYDISEPTFLSTTCGVTTVDLPPGASLSNGMEPPPPIPPFNPKRKRTRTLLDKLGRLEKPSNPGPASAPISGNSTSGSDHYPRSSPPSNLTSPIRANNGGAASDMSRAEREYHLQLQAFQAQHKHSSSPTDAVYSSTATSRVPSSPAPLVLNGEHPFITSPQRQQSQQQQQQQPIRTSPPRFDPNKHERIRTRQRLRKTSSEGANMAVKARQQAREMEYGPVSPMAPNSAKPTFTAAGSAQVFDGEVSPLEGEMRRSGSGSRAGGMF